MIAQLANPSAFNHTLRTSGEGPDGGHSDERSRTASLLAAVTMSATTSAQGLYARPNGGPVPTMLSVYAVGDSRRRPRYRTVRNEIQSSPPRSDLALFHHVVSSSGQFLPSQPGCGTGRSFAPAVRWVPHNEAASFDPEAAHCVTQKPTVLGNRELRHIEH
jgi:hypothetical protein